MAIQIPFPGKLIFLIIVIAMASFCCQNKNQENLSPDASDYIDEVINILNKHSVNKNEIDWQVFKDGVHKVAGNAKTIEETYPAIVYAITELKDNHSYFVSKQDTVSSSEESLLPELQDEIVLEGIAYIRISYCIGNEEDNAKYISSVTGKIGEQNKQQTKGWIIDLRDNFGGNMWPMLSATGPFLPEGTQGYFIHADQQKSTWRYEAGKAMLDSTVLAENPNLISLVQRETKFAILTNAGTASSGEAMAVVFKGLPNAKSFGEKTYGVSTGCKAFELSDGSRINLVTSVFADRNHKKYGSSIIPDVECESKLSLQKAIEWINKDSEN